MTTFAALQTRPLPYWLDNVKAMAMSELNHKLSDHVSVKLCPSKRAKRISLRVSRLTGEVRLTYPASLRKTQALSFARAKIGWVQRQVAQVEPMRSVAPGGQVLFHGQVLDVVGENTRKVSLHNGQLIVPSGDSDAYAERWFRKEARKASLQAVEHYSRKLGKPFSKLAIADPKTRWGSCSSAGRLMLSFRLIMAPPEVLSYVAAHEVAHLAEMNHSDRFWKVCHKLYGDYAAPKAWIKHHGAALHRYTFNPSNPT